ncbi:MAG: flagellar hook-length control protein FliK [Pseudorhodoferax sp.]
MDIEKGAAAGHAGAAAAQRPGGGAKAAALAAASGDFLAMMAALEDGLGLADGDAGGLLPGMAPAEGKRGRRDADALPADAQPADAAALALLLPVPDTPGPAQPTSAAAAAEAAAARLVALPDGGKPAGAGDRQGVQAAGSVDGQAAPAAAAPAAVADPRLAPQYASVFEQLQQHLAAREQAAPESSSARELVAPDAASRQAPPAAAWAGQLREMREPARAERSPGQALPGPARADVQLPVPEAAALGAGARRGGQEAAGDGAGPHGGAHGAAGWAAPDFTPTVQYDAALASLDASAQPDAAFDRQLTDQLRHWASQGVRSAELTVGTSEPVQVRIALDGNEAQVQFRAEHAATRDMLAGSVDQLRDLLGAQGLVLSGVSVGAHGGHDGRGQAGQDAGAQAARQPVAQAAPATEAVAAAPRRPAGALDLYV